MSGFESCAVCGRPVAPVAPPGAPIKVHAVHEERYTTEDLIVCDACAKAEPETLFGSVKEIEARVVQLAEANRSQQYSIEPHGPEGQFALYLGRDRFRHGANLCALYDFDRNGAATRKAIVDALNAIEKQDKTIAALRTVGENQA